jgi:tetratricopeptide (TPR) repeat protein
LRASVAATYCWLDRLDEAVPILEEAARDRFDHLPRNQLYTTAIALYAEAAAQTGDRSAAAILYDLIEPWSDLMVWAGGVCHGDALTYLGLMAATLRRDELADQHFSAACELQADKGMSLWAARAHLGWAEALEVRGDSGRAREEAETAVALSRDHGYREIERRAASLAGSGLPTSA